MTQSLEQALPSFAIAAGAESPADTLRIVPSSYIDYTRVLYGFGGMGEVKGALISARVYSRPFNYPGKDGKPEMVRFEVTDGTYVVRVASYAAEGRRIMAADLIQNDVIWLYGNTQYWNGELQLNNARLVRPAFVNAVQPVYPRDDEGAAEWVCSAVARRELVDEAVAGILSQFPGVDAGEVERRVGLPTGHSLTHWLTTLHRPRSMVEAMQAVAVARRLAALDVLCHAQQALVRPLVPDSAVMVQQASLDALIRALPFTLTDDQILAINECLRDVASDRPMRRLLSGDVGTGKTVVFGVVAAVCYLAGKRSVILVPNVLVVEQHLKDLREWWPNILSIRVNGDTRLKASDLENRPILVGTTALISRLQRLGYHPDLLVVDEQHKLSKEQRDVLLLPTTHQIECTATCIPRTGALVQHGGMDFSVLKQCPYDKHIVSKIFDWRHRKHLFEQVLACVRSGGQVAVVYPKVEGAPDRERDRSAFEDAFELWNKQFPGRVGGLHGQMRGEEKQAVIDAMLARQIDILCCTTVIEVGIDLPSLRLLVAVHAERFGVAQLHQLRGRVARKGGKGSFYMYLPEPVNDEQLERVRLVEHIGDGFVLAEKDLAARGFGDLAGGTTQSGKSGKQSMVRCLYNVGLQLDALKEVMVR